MGFRGSNASGRRIVFYQAHFGRTVLPEWQFLGVSFLLCILQCFRVWEGMLPPGACRMSHAYLLSSIPRELSSIKPN